jgi:hypothetical protein
MSSSNRETPVPMMLRKQLQQYAGAGFNAKRVEASGKGGHFRVWFREFPDVQFLTVHVGDPRAIRNNLSRFKRLRNNQRVGKGEKK